MRANNMLILACNFSWGFLLFGLCLVFAEKEGRGELAIKLPLPPGALSDLYKATDVYTEKYLTTYVAIAPPLLLK